MLVPLLELGIWADVLQAIIRLEEVCDTQLRPLLFCINALVRVVDANGVVVDVLFLLSVREVGEVL